MYVVTPRLVALITQSLRRQRSLRRQWRDWELSGRCPESVRGVSGRRPRRVREASEARPGGVRGASGSCPKDVQIVFQGPSWQNRARALKKSGDSAQSCLTFSVRTVKVLSVVDDFRGGAFSTAGAMNFHDFAKPPRLCRKLKTAAPVHKNCTGHCENVSRT